MGSGRSNPRSPDRTGHSDSCCPILRRLIQAEAAGCAAPVRRDQGRAAGRLFVVGLGDRGSSKPAGQLTTDLAQSIRGTRGKYHTFPWPFSRAPNLLHAATQPIRTFVVTVPSPPRAGVFAPPIDCEQKCSP